LRLRHVLVAQEGSTRGGCFTLSLRRCATERPGCHPQGYTVECAPDSTLGATPHPHQPEYTLRAPRMLLPDSNALYRTPGVAALRFHNADALQSALDAILKVTRQNVLRAAPWVLIHTLINPNTHYRTIGYPRCLFLNLWGTWGASSRFKCAKVHPGCHPQGYTAECASDSTLGATPHHPPIRIP
jgi:hypothetical protein